MLLRITYFLLLFISTLGFSDIFAQTHMTRTITFKNFCNEPVWVAFTPSYIPGNNTFCYEDNDCLRGASCTNQQCVYPIATPEGGQEVSPWKLRAYNPDNLENPGTESKVEVILQYSLPDPANPNEVVYQYVANLGARTGCTLTTNAAGQKKLLCETGQCDTDSSGGCINGMGNPSTHAKIIFNQSNVDFYELSFVNGVNIPIGISPDLDPAAVEPYGQNSLFWCGNSGFLDARGEFYKTQFEANNLLGCNWAFEPPITPAYQGYDSHVFYTVVVYDGNIECSSDRECPATERCGFSASDITGNQQALPKCGRPIAFTVPLNICSSPYYQGAILPKQAFGCYSQPGAMDAFKMQAYAMCALPPNAPTGITAPPTCYMTDSSPPSPDCCGCIAWEKTLPLPQTSECLVGDAVGEKTNFWQTNLRDKVLWLSAHCPAGSAYPFDNGHSIFACTSVKNPTFNDPNQLNYTVTFCPDGQTLFDRRNNDLLSIFLTAQTLQETSPQKLDQ